MCVLRVSVCERLYVCKGYQYVSDYVCEVRVSVCELLCMCVKGISM